jgi:hypothetical protein
VFTRKITQLSHLPQLASDARTQHAPCHVPHDTEQFTSIFAKRVLVAQSESSAGDLFNVLYTEITSVHTNSENLNPTIWALEQSKLCPDVDACVKVREFTAKLRGCVNFCARLGSPSCCIQRALHGKATRRAPTHKIRFAENPASKAAHAAMCVVQCGGRAVVTGVKRGFRATWHNPGL